MIGGHRGNITIAEISAILLARRLLLYRLYAVEKKSTARQRKIIIAVIVAINTCVPLFGDEKALMLLMMAHGAASSGTETYTPKNV